MTFVTEILRDGANLRRIADMHYDFDHPPERRDTDSVKWSRYGLDVLPLWVADMDFVSPAPVVRALRARVDHGVFGYPPGFEPTDLPEFRALIVDRMWQRHAWRVQTEDVIILPGVVMLANLACHAVAAPGGAVVVQPPVYPPILNAAETTGCVRQDALLLQSDGGSYEVDGDRFEAAFTPNTRLFVLCNPHNPTGRVFRRDELERMADICLRQNVIICSDEIHCDLLYSGQRHVPIASLDPEIARRSITLIAPTKTFNLAGLQCSIAIIPDAELRQRYQAARKGLVMWLNLMGLLAGEVAYREGEDWLAQLLVYLEGNRDYLFDFVRRELPGVSMAKPEGTYLAWLDCRQAGIDGSPFEFFLRQARVALGDGATFGPGGQGFVRLNFGCARSTLEEALARIRQACREHLS